MKTNPLKSVGPLNTLNIIQLRGPNKKQYYTIHEGLLNVIQAKTFVLGKIFFRKQCRKFRKGLTMSVDLY